MGKIKEWAFTHCECVCCGKCFLPWQTTHPMSTPDVAPTCSQSCENEIRSIYEQIADTQKEDKMQEEEMMKHLSQTLDDDSKKKIIKEWSNSAVEAMLDKIHFIHKIMGASNTHSELGFVIDTSVYEVTINSKEFETPEELKEYAQQFQNKAPQEAVKTKLDEIDLAERFKS